ncbi:SDR family oxidoreductase [Pseudonocardia sp. CA-107938]|uniref:SDR family oxidoreductase n=1 Tax=Pseudonocardia sp. CA-107938 TaxID=3240021 RepID=UPI003D8FFE65
MEIEESVVVVTGASSGIGRATALALAGQGARTVLVARRAHELDAVAAECEQRGSAALAVPADVTDQEAVERAAAAAVARFGRIDGWVNSAGVTGFAPLLEMPTAEIERILDVNVLGTVHGARAALPVMIEQGSGVLVNLSSLLGVVAPPVAGAYAMSKFAVRGLGVSLREELRMAGVRGVAVSTVLPAAIDTPIYAAAANRTGRRPQPPPPVYSVERAARTVVRALRRPRPELVAGGPLGRLFALQHAVTPRLAERMMAIDMRIALRRPAPDDEGTAGALFTPSTAPGAVDGGFDGARKERVRRAAGVVALAGGAVAAGRRWTS